MKPLTPTRYVVTLSGFAVLLAVLLIISPGIGEENDVYSWSAVWRAKLGQPASESQLRALAHHRLVDQDDDGLISKIEQANYQQAAAVIGFRQRLPRSLLALVVGTTLAMCGATFQVLFRNPLATPYTLGIASGGSLGALIAIRLGLTGGVYGVSMLTLAAFIGGVTVVGTVLLLARGAKRLTSNEMLLAGVTMGMFCSAMMMVVTYLASERETFRMVRWMMGSLDTISNLKTATIIPVALPAWLGLWWLSRALNQYRLGEELAASRGVRVVRLQTICLLLCTLATSAVVAHCGPVGFVGLVVPHMVVLLVGSDQRLALPACGLVGGAFLMLCDWASRLALPTVGHLTGTHLAHATLPIGVVTAVIGVPVFLVFLRWRLRE